MKLAILTTETTHHAYFVREMARAADVVRVVVETRHAVPPFETAAPFETQRESYERATWFAHDSAAVAEFAPTLIATTANETEVVEQLRRDAPDVIVVFGTGLLRGDILTVCPGRTLNLHGGDPERYRGLDSHLWSIYHQKWDGLVTALHHVTERFDAGDLLAVAPIPIRPGMPLAELRTRNTEVCVELVRQALSAGPELPPARPQATAGEYFSFMPAALKVRCEQMFADWTALAAVVTDECGVVR